MCQPGLARPDRSATDKDINRTLTLVGAYIASPRRDSYRFTVDRYGVAKLVTKHAIRGRKFRLLIPGGATPDKNICSALAQGSADGSARRTNDCGVTVDRYGTSEEVVRRSITRYQVPLLVPCGAVADEDVCPSLIWIRLDVLSVTANYHCIRID